MPRSDPPPAADGVHAPVPRDTMHPAARKRREVYAITPGAPLMRTEFGFYSLDAWREQGMPADADKDRLFDFEHPGNTGFWDLGWCEAALCPAFEEKVLEDRGEYELVQDHAGRHVLCFRGRRSGFMPEYVDHPVKDRRSWEERIRWRLDPATPERWAGAERAADAVRADAAQGFMVTQHVIGGYMYLRSLMGPEGVLYAFHDMPDVVHDCMRAWLALADAVTARHQRGVTLDEVFLAEDICSNHGLLIGPDTVREFLLPYYQQLLSSIRGRQVDRGRHLYVQVDTDGDCRPAIPLYMGAIGMDAMSPFEVASGCDVVDLGRRYPRLVMRGGIDKRVLAGGRRAIDEHLERILPAMRARGGYIPCCDHGVPAEVPYEDYLYYRRRAVELGG